MRVAIVNGGLAGVAGNSAVLCDRAARCLERAGVEIERVVLAEARFDPAPIERAGALVIATGTYWSSWSSHLQRWLEDATPTEASSAWLGKPAAVIVSAHQVGASSVLARLQSVLIALGCGLPPMTGVVVTRAS